MTSTHTPGTIAVFVPIGKESPAQNLAATASRATQTDLVIGLLDNHKHNSDAVLDRLQQRLAEKMPAARFVRMKKSEAGKSAPKSMLDDLAARCRVVVNGIGD